MKGRRAQAPSCAALLESVLRLRWSVLTERRGALQAGMLFLMRLVVHWLAEARAGQTPHPASCIDWATLRAWVLHPLPEAPVRAVDSDPFDSDPFNSDPFDSDPFNSDPFNSDLLDPDQCSAGSSSPAYPHVPDGLSPEACRAFLQLIDARPFPAEDVVAALWQQVTTRLQAETRATKQRRAAGVRDVSEQGSPASSAEDALAPERLGMVYQELLGLLLSVEDGGLPVLVPRSRARKGAGVFYTPPSLCEVLAEATLEPLLRDGMGTPLGVQALCALRLCDPAMGGGALLLAAYRVLRSRAQAAEGGRTLTWAESLQLLDCLCGVDLDPLAVELARAALWLEAAGTRALEVSPGPAGLWQQLRQGDALLGTWMVRVPGGSEQTPLSTSASLQARMDQVCLATMQPRGRKSAGEPRSGEPRSGEPRSGEALRGDLAGGDRSFVLGPFFHWELAFSDLFARAGGFDAVLANPPWEIQKPSSIEFFQQVDPGYARLGKQEALQRQRDLCRADPGLELAWKLELERAAARARFLVAGARGNAEDERPFQFQGQGDSNSYKLFLELGLALLRPPTSAGVNAQLGMVLPSGIYTDLGSRPLRDRLLAQGAWRLLLSFENREQLFDIDGRFRFCLLVAQRGGRSEAVTVAFQQRRLGDALRGWPYPLEALSQLSPRAHALVELSSPVAFERFRAFQAAARGLFRPLAPGRRLRPSRELDLTTDSHRFVRVEEARAQGFVPTSTGQWQRKEDGACLEPLWQGAMIGLLQPYASGWDAQTSRWQPQGDDERLVAPQYLVPVLGPDRGAKVVFRTLSNPTNQRTMVACLLPDVPCGNSLGILRLEGKGTEGKDTEGTGLKELGTAGSGLAVLAAVAACLSALVYDWSLRQRMAGTNLNLYLLEETGLPLGLVEAAPRLALPVLRLCGEGPVGQRLWAQARREGLLAQWGLEGDPVRLAQARLKPEARRALRAGLDAEVARLYGLDEVALREVLKDCHHPVRVLKRPSFTAGLEPKGFWRLDAEREPGERYPAEVLRVFLGGG